MIINDDINNFHTKIKDQKVKEIITNTQLSRPTRSKTLVNDKQPQSDAIEDEYGFLEYQNVSRIKLGRYEFNTWYGNSALFKEPVYNRNTNVLQTGLAFKDANQSKSTNNIIYKQNTPQSVIELHMKTTNEVENDKTAWNDILHVCPHCFKFTDIEVEMSQHLKFCNFHDKFPGKIMYMDDNVIIRKIRGVSNKLFCQCMCLMAKFFLDNKSIFYDLNYFDFYVIYGKIDRKEYPMGFYSRELLSWEMNNLSCICVFPCYQKLHLGTKLIDFSYKLSEYEQQISGPERPLSTLGKVTYLKYWSKKISQLFVYGSLSFKKHLTLQIISEKSGFRIDDLLLTFAYMNVLYDNSQKNTNMDYYLHEYKNKDHYVFIQDDKYRVYIDKSKIKKWIIDNNIKNETILNPDLFIFY